MSKNWKSFVEKDSAKRYVLPQGWTSRDDIAGQLECSPDRVRSVLASAIREGTVETKVFPVWSADTKRVVQTVAYREKPAKVV